MKLLLLRLLGLRPRRTASPHPKNGTPPLSEAEILNLLIFSLVEMLRREDPEQDPAVELWRTLEAEIDCQDFEHDAVALDAIARRVAELNAIERRIRDTAEGVISSCLEQIGRYRPSAARALLTHRHDASPEDRRRFISETARILRQIQSEIS